MNNKAIKKVFVIIIAVALSVAFLFTGTANASDWYNQVIYNISANDLARISNETGHYETSSSQGVICPNNSSYFIGSIYKASGEKYSGEEFNNQVAKAASLPFDKSLVALNLFMVNYESRDLTVVNQNTTINIPGNTYESDGNHYPTIIYLEARKSDGTWDTLLWIEPEWSETGTDTTIKCSDYLNKGYVYLYLWTGIATGNGDLTKVGRIIVPDGKLDAFKQMTNYSLTSKTIDVGPEGTMYRLYNENSGEHFYTANSDEAQGLADIGWHYEGHAWQSPTTSSTPVYRVYNPNSGEHHYTSNVGEKNNLVSLGWKDEGIGFYSDDSQGVPMYRLYNPNATGSQEAGAHHYTSNTGERDGLIAIGWRDEGVSWYGLQQ